MALYGEHVGHALPLTGGAHTNWYLNAGLAQRTAEGILMTLPLGGTLRQGSFQVPEQFAYRYNCDGRSLASTRRAAAPTTAKRNRNKEVLMIKSALYAAIGFAAISSIALAGDDREDLSSATAPCGGPIPWECSSRDIHDVSAL
jgi:hypothetical protein